MDETQKYDPYKDTLSPRLKSTVGQQPPRSVPENTSDRLVGTMLTKTEISTAGVEVTVPPIPEDYRMSEEVAEMIQKRKDNENHTPFEDTETGLYPGLVFSSTTDPQNRRMITNMYEVNGRQMAVVHIEGNEGLNNLPIDQLRAKVNEGTLIPFVSPDVSPQ